MKEVERDGEKTNRHWLRSYEVHSIEQNNNRDKWNALFTRDKETNDWYLKQLNGSIKNIARSTDVLCTRNSIFTSFRFDWRSIHRRRRDQSVHLELEDVHLLLPIRRATSRPFDVVLRNGANRFHAWEEWPPPDLDYIRSLVPEEFYFQSRDNQRESLAPTDNRLYPDDRNRSPRSAQIHGLPRCNTKATSDCIISTVLFCYLQDYVRDAGVGPPFSVDHERSPCRVACVPAGSTDMYLRPLVVVEVGYVRERWLKHRSCEQHGVNRISMVVILTMLTVLVELTWQRESNVDSAHNDCAVEDWQMLYYDDESCFLLTYLSLFSWKINKEKYLEDNRHTDRSRGCFSILLSDGDRMLNISLLVAFLMHQIKIHQCEKVAFGDYPDLVINFNRDECCR